MLLLLPPLLLTLLVPLTPRPAAVGRLTLMLDSDEVPEAFKRKPKPPEIRLVDREGDEVRFVLERAGLELYVDGELFSGAVETITYNRTDGTVAVEDEEVEGSFQLSEEEQTLKATTLSVFSRQAGAEWLCLRVE